MLESAASNVLKNANLITLTKSTVGSDRNLTTKVVARLWENDEASPVEVSGEKVWRDFGFFEARRADYNMEKVKFPENTLLYVNQSYLTIQKNKKIYYSNYCIIGQIVEASNPPLNIDTYELKDREVKMVRPKYNVEAGEFLGLYKTVGFLLVRGNAEEIFLNYGFDKEIRFSIHTAE